MIIPTVLVIKGKHPFFPCFLFFNVPNNDEYKISSRLRGTLLSSYKKVEASYKPLIHYFIGYYFYTLCVP